MIPRQPETLFQWTLVPIPAEEILEDGRAAERHESFAPQDPKGKLFS